MCEGVSMPLRREAGKRASEVRQDWPAKKKADLKVGLYDCRGPGRSAPH